MNRAERRRLEKEAKKARQANTVSPAGVEKSYEFYNQARVYESEGNTIQAVKAYQQALKLNPDFPEALNNLGNIYEIQGRMQEAENAYKKALKTYPDNTTLLNNLGNVLRNQNMLGAAAEYLTKALELEPENVLVLNNLGNTYIKQKKIEQARVLFEKAIKLDSNRVETYINLASALEEQDAFSKAIVFLEKAIALDPNSAVAYYNLGHVLHSEGKTVEAADAYEQAVKLQPDYVQAYYNLAVAYRHCHEYKKAIESLKQATTLKPDGAELYAELGYVFAEAGMFQDAFSALDKAISLKPKEKTNFLRLGQVYSKAKDTDKAIAAYKQALKIDSRYTQAYINLGVLYGEMYKFNDACKVYQKALSLEPENGVIYINLAGTFLDQGNTFDAIKLYQDALECEALRGIDSAPLYSNLLFAMNYPVQITAEQLYQEHLEYAKRYELPFADSIKPHGNIPDTQKCIRVAYISQDFRQHSVAYFLQPLLQHRDKSSVEVFCYAEVAKPDDVTRQIQANVDGWRDIVGKSDEAVSELIREDKIDILIDLTGHTAAGARLPVFTRKPAPVQATYLGYPNTTGLSSIDYRLTDVWADPEGQEKYHTETLVRLPKGFLCYRAARDVPEVATLPVDKTGHITFGSFNNLSKVVPEVIDLWSEILLAVPGSKLLLKNRSLRDEDVCKDYLGQFVQRGINADRIELIGYLPDAGDHLKLYGRIDIGLDTFPYNGTTTTCEAMWMGVPVITLCGDRHAARVGNSLLHQVDLDELVAHNEAEYIGLAKTMANDTIRLRQLREGMRDRLLNSPLCDEEGFTRQLEQAYREMWVKWCEQQKS